MINNNMVEENIELLGLDLFVTNMEEMEIVKKFQKHFDADLGWHYYLDLAWILRKIKELPRGALVLDAGAGSGLLQFILSELGYNVISADFADRSFSSKYIEDYGCVIHALNNQKKTFINRYTKHIQSTYGGNNCGKMSKFLGLFRREDRSEDLLTLIDNNRFTPREDSPKRLLNYATDETLGRIFLYKCNLKEMSLLPDCYVDAVVSISALEHNDHKDFEKCIEELLRVTKPSGKLFTTVSAAQQSEDWYHLPSKGWCYCEASLKKLFRLPEDVQSNFPQKDLIFKEMRQEGNQLHNKLAPVYFHSGENGMPWGKWDPEYLPVGILKIKG